MGRCQHRSTFHGCLDTHATAVEAELRRVIEFMRIESRERDTARLLKLKERFLNLSVPSDVTDVHYVMLRFLICLTGDLSRVSQRTEEAMEIESCEEMVDKDDVTLSHSSSGTAAASASELSSWSEEDIGEESSQTAVSSEDIPQEAALLNWEAYFVPFCNAEVSVDRSEQLADGSLLECLTKIQLPEVPLSACLLFLRSESDLVLGCLRVLQGRDSVAFQWDRCARAFAIDVHLQTLHFSAAAMRHMLEWFGRYGCDTRCLLEWTGSVVDVSSRQELSGSYGRRPLSSQPVICPTLSATAHAIQAELNRLLRPLIQMEHLIECDPSRRVTLVHLKCLTSATARQIRVLHSVVRELQRVLKSEMSPSAMTSAVLDCLFDMATKNEANSSPLFQAGNEMIWNVFVEALSPLLAHLTAWLYMGDVSSLSDDFFISSMPARQTEEADFWLDAYVLKEDGCCPKFLSPIVSAIHDGGKALQFMRNQEQGCAFDKFGMQEIAGTGKLEGLISDQWTNDHLRQQFMKYLASHREDAVAEGMSESNSLAQKMAVAGKHRGEDAVHILQLQEAVPWEYVADEDTAAKSRTSSTSPNLYSQSCTHDDDDVTAAPHESVVGMAADASDWPDSYVDIGKAMERVRNEFESALLTQPSHCK